MVFGTRLELQSPNESARVPITYRCEELAYCNWLTAFTQAREVFSQFYCREKERERERKTVIKNSNKNIMFRLDVVS